MPPSAEEEDKDEEWQVKRDRGRCFERTDAHPSSSAPGSAPTTHRDQTAHMLPLREHLGLLVHLSTTVPMSVSAPIPITTLRRSVKMRYTCTLYTLQFSYKSDVVRHLSHKHHLSAIGGGAQFACLCGGVLSVPDAPTRHERKCGALLGRG
ncbi:hypothetical protein H0H81_004093 [Sphagnurus paluster]|uniref:Uncharacterized protein n=1 Tax=Sphagnurus paluster TaxID=117069 RepID=A0A9P7K5D5_9AGAR|nr:hypothetical protein H0H81_004093 [Sphagnurus paluster]